MGVADLACFARELRSVAFTTDARDEPRDVVRASFGIFVYFPGLDGSAVSLNLFAFIVPRGFGCCFDFASCSCEKCDGLYD